MMAVTVVTGLLTTSGSSSSSSRQGPAQMLIFTVFSTRGRCGNDPGCLLDFPNLVCADWNTPPLKWIYYTIGSFFKKLFFNALQSENYNLTPDFPFNSKDLRRTEEETKMTLLFCVKYLFGLCLN